MTATDVEGDGIVGFPITHDTDLNQGVWTCDSSDGSDGRPQISPDDGVLQVRRQPSSAYNVWTHVTVNHDVDPTDGSILQFDLRIGKIARASEVKLQLAAGVILRYDGYKLKWVEWLPDFERFITRGISGIRVGDEGYTRIVLCVSRLAVSVFENGIYMAQYGSLDRSPLGVYQPVFHWQVLEGLNELHATFGRILVIPLTFDNVSAHTPWTVALSSKEVRKSEVWSAGGDASGPIPITYHDGFMRIATESLSQYNAWVYPELRTPLPTHGIITYRVRVNQSTGSETKVTVLGDHILRFTNEGQRVEWTWYSEQGEFIKLSDSSIRCGGDYWTTVTVVFNSTDVALLENGLLRFARVCGSPLNLKACFWVQHLDLGTAVSVDISHIQAIPLLSTASDRWPIVL